ncbi:MAG: hypothetical protein U9Q33_11125 [Campylobacterota bacterium]|nr:hypothetical protein [Campylobacterota bacterium]
MKNFKIAFIFILLTTILNGADDNKEDDFLKTIDDIEKNYLKENPVSKNIDRNNFYYKKIMDLDEIKKLKELKISSIYSFNGINHVVFRNIKLDRKSGYTIDGRFRVNDSVLNHKIILIDKNTNTVTLHKEFDKSYEYFIYLSSQGISISVQKR